MSSGSDDDVVKLSQHRARLSRARRARRGDDLLDAEDPVAAIQALPADEFYYILAERGFPEAQDILIHGSPAQVQGTLDFAIWDRDRLSPRDTLTWVAALADAPTETINAWLMGIDIELTALLIRQRARIYNLGLEVPPDDPEGVFWQTPDSSFLFDLRGDSEQQQITQRIVGALYEADVEKAREMLVGLANELDSQLEELAYRWRSGRMEDLGFSDYYEALEIYRPIDPATVKIGEGRKESAAADPTSDSLRAPLVLADTMAEGSLFSRAAANITDAAELASIHSETVLLSNRLLSAERVRPSDAERINQALLRMRCTVDLALEHLAGDDEGKATEALRTIALVRIFRLGATLVGKVGELVRTLRRRHPFAVLDSAATAQQTGGHLPFGFFEAEDALILDELGQTRPMFPITLDPDSEGRTGTRPFGALADIARATAAVERAAMSVALPATLGIRPEDVAGLAPETRVHFAGGKSDMRSSIDVGVVARTALALRLLKQPCPPLRGLKPEELAQLSSLATDDADLAQLAVDAIRAARPGLPLSPAGATIAERWGQALKARLGILIAPTTGQSDAPI